MDNLSITSLVLEQPWTGTVQVCIDQAQYTELGRKIMVTIGLAFLLGFFMGELTDYVVKKVKKVKKQEVYHAGGQGSTPGVEKGKVKK
jgi:hypothetical protein